MMYIYKILPLFLCLFLTIESNGQLFKQNLSSSSQVKNKQKYKSNNSPFTEYRSMSIIPDAKRDGFGNADGNKYDLVKDGAFQGLQIAVLHLYIGEGFNFSEPQKALVEKGFTIKRWRNTPPSANELKNVLANSCQLWIISDRTKKLTDAHLQVIKEFFNAGKGLYIWGDNVPYYADANYVANALFGGNMTGDTRGDKVLSFNKYSQQKMGIKGNHDITTGIANLYEGITIATIKPNNNLTPLLYGSAKNLITAIYNKNGKRAIIDGGFTRLYVKWDTAGTGRYVKNAAAWLVNYDRFGNNVFL